MNEDYVWDQSGEPDEEVIHLEELLGRLRWSETHQQPYARPLEWWHERRWWTLAAALVLGIGTAFFVQTIHRPGTITPWQLSLASQQSSAVRAGK